MEILERVPHGPWRPQRYFAIQKPISKLLELHVSAGLLVERFGINLKTIRNGVSKYMQGGSSNWKAYRDRDAVMIVYDHLTENQKSKLNLPSTSKEAYDILRGDMAMQKDLHRETEINHLKLTFDEAYQNHWPACLKFYLDRIDEERKRIIYAKSHSLIEVIIKAAEKRWPSKVIFATYSAVMKAQLDSHEKMRFQTASSVYFWRVIRNCRLHGIPETLVHDSLGVSKEHFVKLTGPIRAFIRLQMRSEKRTLIVDIIKEVERKFGVTLSRSSIKSFKADRETRNILEYDSNGKILSRQNGLPKITRFLAEGPGEQYQGDYYFLQFYCRGTTGLPVRLWSFVVLDVFSRKVVGWSLGEERSATMAMDAFRMAFVDNYFLPEEILIDNDSLYQRPIFKRFLRRINNLGVITTKAYPNIPTWKAEIESFFSVFQKLHSSKPWYIGEGVKSKNKAGIPTKGYIDKLYNNPLLMLSVPEMIIEFKKMIEEYNNLTNDRKKKVSPSDYFKMHSSNRTIPLQSWMEPLLFWTTIKQKRIKGDGRIDLEINKVGYCYQVTKAELLWKYKNSDVRMCYNPDDLSVVHIFERLTLKYIGAIEPRMVMLRENKKEVLKKQRRILRTAQQYHKDKRQQDEALANGDTEFIRAETLEDRMIRRKMAKAKFQQEVAEVEVHP